MANLNPWLSLEPFEPQDIGKATGVPTNTAPHCPPDDILQLQTDVLNVLEGRVKIETFDVVYQKRIKDFYRYSATVHLSKYPVIAKRTLDTLDLV
jgi:hypothetical protein